MLAEMEVLRKNTTGNQHFNVLEGKIYYSFLLVHTVQNTIDGLINNYKAPIMPIAILKLMDQGQAYLRQSDWWSGSIEVQRFVAVSTR